MPDKNNPFSVINNKNNIENIEYRLNQRNIGENFIRLIEDYSEYCSQGFRINIVDCWYEESQGMVPERWICQVHEINPDLGSINDRSEFMGFGADPIEALSMTLSKLDNMGE